MEVLLVKLEIFMGLMDLELEKELVLRESLVKVELD